MDQNQFNNSTRSQEGEKYSSGIASVVIPAGVDRELYIKRCYDTNTVSIYSELNGLNNGVPIDRYSFNFIEFPSNVNEFGSQVSFQILETTNTPIITGIYLSTDQLSELQEHQFRFKRKLNGEFVELVGSAKDKSLGINISADKKGEIFLNVKSKNLSGKLNIQVDGDTNISSTGNLFLKQFQQYTCVTVNEKNNNEFSSHEQTSTDESFYNKKTNVYTDKLNINDGEEPFVLGKAFASFMKDMVEEVGNSKVSTAIGLMPLMNSVQIKTYKDKVDKLLSTIGFIDK